VEFIPLVYFALVTIAMAIYCDKQMITCENPSKVINEFMIVLAANIFASGYMLYCIFVSY